MMGMNQIYLLAQGRNSGDWIELVALLILVLISAGGGLIKRYIESRRQQDPTALPPPGEKPRAKANWRQRLEQEIERVRTEVAQRTAGESEAGEEPSRPGTPADVRPAMTKTRERGRAAKKAVAKAGEIRKSSLQMPELTPELVGASSEPQVEPASVLSANRVLVDFSDPEALKRAIIQYEVLGKPLGLRDQPSEGGAARVY